MIDTPLYKFKAKEAAKLLIGNVGVHIKSKDEHLLGVSENENATSIQIFGAPDRTVKIIGVSGSSADMSEAIKLMGSFESKITTILSSRDISSSLLKDFLSNYIRSRFYDHDDETPLALEFIILEYRYIFSDEPLDATDKVIGFSGIKIDFYGNYEIISQKNISIIGIPIDQDNKEIANLIRWRDLPSGEAKDMAEILLGQKFNWMPSAPIKKEDEIEESDEQPT